MEKEEYNLDEMYEIDYKDLDTASKILANQDKIKDKRVIESVSIFLINYYNRLAKECE